MGKIYYDEIMDIFSYTDLRCTSFKSAIVLKIELKLKYQNNLDECCDEVDHKEPLLKLSRNDDDDCFKKRIRKGPYEFVHDE